MSIKILPARLANQIAAGEVVERPASVLKELLENSIDAGATAIEVDIEKGGHKKIKLTDNGSGINKDELTLALSRHATSKIHDLDDLENIITLGFRGEALASISSVSRLTLTSKTEEQNEAWQARCEGRDMQVLVEPAAHPKGTSVEVLDLFFNTPARRKFLRTEKTEFNHIDDLFRRFALSQFGVSLKLKHNGKLVKSLPAIQKRGDYLKRIRQICGANASDGLLEINSDYQQFRLWGWISAPGKHQAMNDNQFVFVNNRMMKDKLIFHAIRQAYEGLLPEDKFPYFVLYLEIPTDEVDVNVHPAKHEVRFYQSRLIHDFIFSAINDALGEGFNAQENPVTEIVNHQYQADAMVSEPAPQAIEHEFIAPLRPVHQSGQVENYAGRLAAQKGEEQRFKNPAFTGQNNMSGLHQGASFKAAAENYQTLVTAPETEVHAEQHITVPGKGLLVKKSGDFWFIPRHWLVQEMLTAQYAQCQVVMQPLLLPVSVICKPSEVSEQLLALCQSLGLELQLQHHKLMLKGVPVGARQQRWQEILLALSVMTLEANKDNIIAVLANYWRLADEENLMPLWLKVQEKREETPLEQVARKLAIADWLESLA